MVRRSTRRYGGTRKGGRRGGVDTVPVPVSAPVPVSGSAPVNGSETSMIPAMPANVTSMIPSMPTMPTTSATEKSWYRFWGGRSRRKSLKKKSRKSRLRKRR